MPQSLTYPEWIHEVRSLVAKHRPDIPLVDIDPNGSFAAWEQGTTPADFTKGAIPLKAGSHKAQNSFSISPDDLDDFLGVGRSRARSNAVHTGSSTRFRPKRNCVYCPRCSTPIPLENNWPLMIAACLLVPIGILLMLIAPTIQCPSCRYVYKPSPLEAGGKRQS